MKDLQAGTSLEFLEQMHLVILAYSFLVMIPKLSVLYATLQLQLLSINPLFYHMGMTLQIKIKLVRSSLIILSECNPLTLDRKKKLILLL